MGLFFKKPKEPTEADRIYQEAKQRAYHRQLKKVAASRGFKDGKAEAEAKFNMPQSRESVLGQFQDFARKAQPYGKNIMDANDMLMGIPPKKKPQ